MSFEIYTDKIGESARNIIREAYQDAASLGHHQLAPEHVLKAYAAIERARFDDLMKRLDLERHLVLQALSAKLSEGYPVAAGMKISDTFRTTLTGALEHAREKGRARIEAIDLLAGLLADARSFPASMFERLGVDHETVIKQIRDLDAGR